jgi:hypothetical protein
MPHIMLTNGPEINLKPGASYNALGKRTGRLQSLRMHLKYKLLGFLIGKDMVVWNCGINGVRSTLYLPLNAGVNLYMDWTKSVNIEWCYKPSNDNPTNKRSPDQ